MRHRDNRAVDYAIDGEGEGFHFDLHRLADIHKPYIFIF